MSSPQQPEQEKGGLDKPAARAALPEQSEAEFEPAGKLGIYCAASVLVSFRGVWTYALSLVESPPKVLRDFVEEPVVRETILVTGSCDEGVFSLPTPVVQVDGSGTVG